MQKQTIYQRLEQILSSETESKECKPETLDITDLDASVKEYLENEIRTIKEINRKRLPLSWFYNNQKHLAIDKKQSLLFPLIPEETIFIHKGLLVNGQNNLNNLEKYAVFGNPSEKAPTYLSGINETPMTNALPDCILAVDTKKLSKKRSIFIDPETIYSSNEDIGDSYFVLGGIPKEAIIEILYNKRTVSNPNYPKMGILNRFISYNPIEEKAQLRKEYEKTADSEWTNILKSLRR